MSLSQALADYCDEHGIEVALTSPLAVDTESEPQVGAYRLVSIMQRVEVELRLHEGGKVGREARVVDVDHEAIMAASPTDALAHLARVVVHLASLRQQYGEESIALLPPSLYGPFERLGALVLAWLYGVVVAPEGQAAGGMSWAYAPGLAESDGAGGQRVPEATQAALGGDSATAPVYPDDLDVEADSSSPEEDLGDAFVSYVASSLSISGAEAQRRINRTYAQMYGGREDGQGGHTFTRAIPGAT